ncbi:hypothetical protein BMA721280_I0334 [Burkholderia mallei 2002721280]|nr:hypothetical protein BMA10229_1816 [Burkholderia mallei NCTC 10229]EDK86455.1 hypothetical protein BMA721280_I0334 [Burkholderia mallei 2002721280]EDU12529.1 hypothetical protein BURPS1655_D1431 [Burkholderia pseudomallei 1655]EEC34924.1 hypothetical protein BUC_6622 [Burkholderia pseudomallei 576]EEH28331.1 hypothetical protein BUH_6720 [Burkholderia pseudomallei Pakistan 9]EEP51522.1 hypothetical protein GBP346_B1776 [Burkholderia pseudomallei MSHR346]EEP87250.1 hypothetical protein BMAG
MRRPRAARPPYAPRCAGRLPPPLAAVALCAPVQLKPPDWIN